MDVFNYLGLIWDHYLVPIPDVTYTFTSIWSSRLPQLPNLSTPCIIATPRDHPLFKSTKQKQISIPNKDCQAVVRQWSGSGQAVIRQWSGSCQAVIRQSPVLNKVIIEKSWYEIFTEQELRFGLELDQLALLKKKLHRL